jgi:hypothetical protein
VSGDKVPLRRSDQDKSLHYWGAFIINFYTINAGEESFDRSHSVFKITSQPFNILCCFDSSILGTFE